MNKIFKNTLSLSSASALTTILNIVCMPIIIRQVGVDSYGVYIYAFIQSQLLLTIVNYSFDIYLVNKCANMEQEEINKYVLLVYISRFSIFIVFSTIMYVGLVYFGSLDKIFLLVIIISILPMCFNLTWYYQLKERMEIIAIANLVGKSVFLIFILFPFSSILYLAYALLVSNIIVVIVYNINYKWSFDGIYHVKIIDLNKLVINAFPIFTYQFLTGLIPVVVSSFIFNISGGGGVVYLDIFNKITSVINLIYSAFIQSIYPYITKIKSKYAFYILVKRTLLLIFIPQVSFLLIVVMLNIKLDTIFNYILKADLKSIYVIIIYSLFYSLFISFNSFLSRVLIFFDCVKIITISTIVALIVISVFSYYVFITNGVDIFIGLILGQIIMSIIMICTIYLNMEKKFG
ncbi:oligosaccharide flippase family protein [Photobacterium leiognathi]|uniref:oligosaccharide flippase family protein n=1 Tax=Photobacterium leiognathi TaxID=553611 RepID=UPI002981446E|nr:oligosaccharide flippase family protein [Photobacterium leiognathi]